MKNLRNDLTPAEREELFKQASRIADDEARAAFGREYAQQNGLEERVVQAQVSWVRIGVDRVLAAVNPRMEILVAAQAALEKGNVPKAVMLYARAGAITELQTIGTEYEKRQPLFALSAFEGAKDITGVLRILKQAQKNGDEHLAAEALRSAQKIATPDPA